MAPINVDAHSFLSYGKKSLYTRSKATEI